LELCFEWRELALLMEIAPGRALVVSSNGIDLLATSLQTRLDEKAHVNDDTQAWCIRALASIARDSSSFPTLQRYNLLQVVTKTVLQQCAADASATRRKTLAESALRFIELYGSYGNGLVGSSILQNSCG
jgi:hypothetical protein